MNWQEFSALLLLATASSFTPGPNTTLSTALAANFGLRRAMRFVCAVPVGWSLLLALCSAGVGRQSWRCRCCAGPSCAGVAYLLWLAARLANSRQLAGGPDAPERELRPGRDAAVSQHQGLDAGAVHRRRLRGRPAAAAAALLLILPVMLCFAFFSNLAYALVGSLLRHWLAQGQRLLVFNRVMASALAATAAWLLWSAL
jgi:threonine/homoserine/homoserine lactone efflux protein